MKKTYLQDKDEVMNSIISTCKEYCCDEIGYMMTSIYPTDPMDSFFVIDLKCITLNCYSKEVIPQIGVCKMSRYLEEDEENEMVRQYNVIYKLLGKLRELDCVFYHDTQYVEV